MLTIMKSNNYLHYIFRVSCAMCFIGHGAFGIITKPIWCNYFGVFGISQEVAYQLMPLVGVVDIVLGVSLLIFPIRAIAGWLMCWGLFTALLRPLSGEPVAEFFERAGNYGAPLILLLLANSETSTSWFSKIEKVKSLDEDRFRMVIVSLQIIGFILLFGHGWLNLIEKQGLVKQYAAFGFENPNKVAFIVGLFEIAGSLFIILKPYRRVIFVLFIWKVASELLHPAYGLLEWIERCGSYGILLGLWLALKSREYLPKSAWFQSHKINSHRLEMR
jgi:hypothetical protein